MNNPSSSDSQERLRSVSFLSLLGVQFLTALNDNTFRWLVVPLAKPLLKDDAAALSLGLVAITLPFILLSAPAGFLADRFAKGRVISTCKLSEIVILAGGMLAILTGSVPLLFLTIFLTGSMSALFAPSKLGSLPELVHDSQLSNANGLMGLMNVVPCALGFLLGNYLAGLVQPTPETAITLARLIPAAVIVMTIAVAGWGVSLLVKRVPAADPGRPFSWNLPKQSIEGVAELARDGALLRTALGIAFFWMLASLANMNIDPFGIHDLGLSQMGIGVLGMTLVLGVAVGSVMAGLWSGHQIELGIVPVGALGITLCSFILFAAGSHFEFSSLELDFQIACGGLFCLGVSAGLFDVPLEAYLQYRSNPARLGVVVGATNFLAFCGILLIAGLFWVLRGMWGWSASQVFLLAGLATIPVLIYIVVLLPGACIRLLFGLFVKLCYRVRVYDRQRVPLTGGALMVSNHVTWVDGILLMLAAPRPVRFIAFADFVHHPRLSWLAKIYEVIPIKADAGPKALLQSLKTAREAVEQGSLVCIFAEGTLTRTGQMQPFQGGLLRIINGTNAPVIPVYLHGLWGSIFSYRGGKFFWKWPSRIPYPVSIHFGEPIAVVENVETVASAVRQLGVEAVERAKSTEFVLPRMFLRACRRGMNRTKVADSGGAQLTGAKLMAGSLALRNKLVAKYFAPDEKMIGILVPPSVGGVLANTAVTLAGRVSVNLNYTLSDTDLQFCAREAGLKHVLTSKKMLEKRPVELPGVQWIFLEDLKTEITGFDKAIAGLQTYATPMFILDRWLGLTRLKPDDLMTIIFTSGSTGEPKGVMLSYHNVGSNVTAVDQLFQFDDNDCMMGVLPFFHSFGYTACLWLVIALKLRAVYHYNPLDAREIGKLAEKHGMTILMATATFLRSYIKRIDKEQFSKLDLVIVGAEKMPLDLAEQFREKFGVMPSEGYGATETSPVASVNIPDHRSDWTTQKGTKLGSVGRPLPNVTVKTVDPDTGADLGIDKEGLLLIKGPNIMQGYLNRPDKTAAVIHDGWYNTGDMARVDPEGFIFITGRLSRFSKIGGEMVPHIKIEEHLVRIMDDPENDEPGPVVAVTAVPDEKKGERIVVLHKPSKKAIPQILKELAECDLPNLWLPGNDCFVEVPSIPLLGTGKADLKAIKQLALERFGKA